jgi:hypothetical protein
MSQTIAASDPTTVELLSWLSTSIADNCSLKARQRLTLLEEALSNIVAADNPKGSYANHQRLRVRRIGYSLGLAPERIAALETHPRQAFVAVRLALTSSCRPTGFKQVTLSRRP